MNFRIVENGYVNIKDIEGDFEKDYIFSNALRNNEIRVKYGLTHGEFKELAEFCKQKHGLSRRPRWDNNAKYYYPVNHGFVIFKTIDCVQTYIGFVTSEEGAIRLVELCKKLLWNVDMCRDLVRNYNEC